MGYGNYPDLQKVRKILVVKLRHHGDVLLSSPVFSCLKSRLPNAEIDALLYQETAPMLQGHPAISHLYLYNKQWKKEPFLKKWKEEFRLLSQVRNKHYDLVINLTEGDRGAIIASFSRAPIRVGFDPGNNGFFRKASLFSHLVKRCTTPRHAVEVNLDALRRIGIFPNVEERELVFHIPQEAYNPTLPSDYVVIHPASRWKFKSLPIEKIAELMCKLHDQGEKIVLTASGDVDEVTMVEKIIALCPHVSPINLAGRTNLKELGAVIAKAKLIFCVDSVPLHLASALKTPVVALFGPTSELCWGPWQHPKGVVVAKSMSCRPCGLDGCGGSKQSDCLATLSIDHILKSSPK